ncbi:protein AmbC [Catellatospora sp. IY07-71]|nr:protein AmbC [Catellatospora sp. IY07-71]
MEAMSEPLRIRVDGTAPPTIDLEAVSHHGVQATMDWIAEHRSQLDVALSEHGALYFAGAGIAGREDFAAVRDVVFDEPAAYHEKATPRTDFGSGVYSSTDLPPAQSIRQHNENSYTLSFPGRLLFGCVTAPTYGGATTVADVRAVLGALPERITGRMAETGWALTRNYQAAIGLPWTTAFGTERESDVEAYCAANAMRCTWVDGVLRTEQNRPGIIRHPVSGESVWFNHAAFWSEWSLDPAIRDMLIDEFDHDGLPFATSYGDGAALTEADVAEINSAYDRMTRRRPWARGDLLLVDNVMSSHGRDSFSGARDIVVAMGDPVTLADCVPQDSAVLIR